MIRIEPLTMPCQKLETLLRVSPFWTTPRKTTPITVPKMPPTPPVKLVPPISTAASTVSSRFGSGVGAPAVRRPTEIRQASPAASPASV